MQPTTSDCVKKRQKHIRCGIDCVNCITSLFFFMSNPRPPHVRKKRRSAVTLRDRAAEDSSFDPKSQLRSSKVFPQPPRLRQSGRRSAASKQGERLCLSHQGTDRLTDEQRGCLRRAQARPPTQPCRTEQRYRTERVSPTGSSQHS